MSGRDPQHAVLYRWRIHAGQEAAFIAAWSRITVALRDRHGSLGSRLHRGPDGLWYAYAQWPDAAAREQAFTAEVDAAARRDMDAAVVERLPEIVLEPVADYLILPGENCP